jgi:UPF0716 family protein affecting phage T7 exclusion
MWQRGVLFVAALLLIAPELISSLIGVALLAIILAVQVVERRRAAESSARAA